MSQLCHTTYVVVYAAKLTKLDRPDCTPVDRESDLYKPYKQIKVKAKIVLNFFFQK